MLLLSVLLLVSRVQGVYPECGERPIFEAGPQHSRIIEGKEAKVGEFPWLVSIQAGNEHFCGGAIIDEWWIVTAAHCVHSGELEPRDLKVVLGTNDLQSPSLEVKEVTSIVVHKDFERTSVNNDIALLLLSSYITFGGLKEPICMPRRPGPSTWSECWVAGWGQTKAGDKSSMGTDLMKVPMIIMDWEKCSKVFPKLTKNMLCAGYENASYDSCQSCDNVPIIRSPVCDQGRAVSPPKADGLSDCSHAMTYWEVSSKGDSGGPLVCTTGSDKKWYQVGIVSWGRSCGQKDTPGVYTLLENYSPWIKKVMEVEGRPYRAQRMRVPSPRKPMGSRAPESPEPGSPRLRLLLCLLPYMLF